MDTAGWLVDMATAAALAEGTSRMVDAVFDRGRTVGDGRTVIGG